MFAIFELNNYEEVHIITCLFHRFVEAYFYLYLHEVLYIFESINVVIVVRFPRFEFLLFDFYQVLIIGLKTILFITQR